MKFFNGSRQGCEFVYLKNKKKWLANNEELLA